MNTPEKVLDLLQLARSSRERLEISWSLLEVQTLLPPPVLERLMALWQKADAVVSVGPTSPEWAARYEELEAALVDLNDTPDTERP